MEFLIGCLETFPLEMDGGGQMGKRTYTMGGVVANVNVRTMGEGGGSNFSHFGVYVLIERPCDRIITANDSEYVVLFL